MNAQHYPIMPMVDGPGSSRAKLGWSEVGERRWLIVYAQKYFRRRLGPEWPEIGPQIQIKARMSGLKS